MSLVSSSSLNCKSYHNPLSPINNPNNFKLNHFQFSLQFPERESHSIVFSSATVSHNLSWSYFKDQKLRRRFQIFNNSGEDATEKGSDDNEVNSLGVNAALSMLRFYKREISPLSPNSCRYVPTCSEYSMIAYKKYGVVKGTALTAWRLCRCNPIGGSGFDPPRWFGETTPPEQ